MASADEASSGKENKVLIWLKNRSSFIHPVAFALFPLTSFIAANYDEIRSSDARISVFIIFNLAIAAIAMAISLLITRSRQQAGILASLMIGIFFMFGRVDTAMGDYKISTPLTPLGPTKILLIASAVLVVGVWFWLRKISVNKLAKTNKVLLLISLAMLVSSILTALPKAFAHNTPGVVELTSSSSNSKSTNKNLPDIYYILLDGYERADVLKNKFHYDNSPFINGLKDKGFYVADKSHSNYSHTHVSVPSTFNMTYLDQIASEVGPTSRDASPLIKLTEENSVAKKLKAYGYKYVLIGSQWYGTKTSPLADIKIKSKYDDDSKILGIQLNDFSLIYLQTTALKPWISTSISGTLAARTLGAFEKTAKVPDIKAPTFSFTHIGAPHQPYLFNKNGLINQSADLKLEGAEPSAREKYRDQTAYVNKLTLNLVDTILKKSSQPPIIIVASDHGSAIAMGAGDFKQTDKSKMNIGGVRERMSNLNTYYFPDKNYKYLYPSITPVNSFRVIFKQFFNENIDLLPDKSYLSDNKSNLYRLTDITDIVNP